MSLLPACCNVQLVALYVIVLPQCAHRCLAIIRDVFRDRPVAVSVPWTQFLRQFKQASTLNAMFLRGGLWPVGACAFHISQPAKQTLTSNTKVASQLLSFYQLHCLPSGIWASPVLPTGVPTVRLSATRFPVATIDSAQRPTSSKGTSIVVYKLILSQNPISAVNKCYVARVRLQNVNGGHSGTLAFYFCPFWGACRQVTRACRQDYFFVVDI